MNSLHPTATDGCDSGLHSFVGGRCRDCGALAESTRPTLPAGAATGERLRFVLTVEMGESTRLLTTFEKLSQSMVIIATTACRVFTSGAVPRVTCEFLPEQAVTAASAPLVGAASCEVAPAATDPARSGCFRCGACGSDIGRGERPGPQDA